MTEPFSNSDDQAVRALVEQAHQRMAQKERLVTFFHEVTELELNRDQITAAILMAFIKEHGELTVFEWIALAAEREMVSTKQVGQYVSGIRRKFKEESLPPSA